MHFAHLEVLYNGARESCSHKCSITLRTDIFSEPGLLRHRSNLFTSLRAVALIKVGIKTKMLNSWTPLVVIITLFYVLHDAVKISNIYVPQFHLLKVFH